jgi:hypothetical protein
MADNTYHNKMTEQDYEYVRQNYQNKEIKEIAKALNKAPQIFKSQTTKS